jgi:hypothetical protein
MIDQNRREEGGVLDENGRPATGTPGSRKRRTHVPRDSERTGRCQDSMKEKQ